MIAVLLYVALVGVIVYAIVTFIPMPAPFQQIIIVIAIILVLLWLLSVFGAISAPPLRGP